MRKLGMVLIGGLLVGKMTLAAAECPNIDGYFDRDVTLQSTYISHIVQKGCSKLTLKKAFVDGHRVITEERLKEFVPADQPERCSRPGRCKFYTIDQRGFVIAEGGSVDDFEHGVCSFTSRIWNDDQAGRLVQTYANSRCADGFSGDFARLFHRRAMHDNGGTP